MGSFSAGFFGKWFKNKDGTTAIEFSLLSIPYLLITLGIIELALMYSAASLLEGATGSAARLVRTGQIQQSQNADSEGIFRTAICEYATVLIRCDDVVIEVVPLQSFSDADSLSPQFDDEGNLTSRGFDAGGSSGRVLIRVGFRYQMMTPFIGPLLAGADNSIQFLSTIVLQSEPYDFEENVS